MTIYESAAGKGEKCLLQIVWKCEDINMKRENILFPAASLGLALLMAGCGAVPADGAATGETAAGGNAAETTAEPAYTGPLYELTFENLTETVPGFRDISRGEDGLSFSFPYDGMALWSNFRENNIVQISREQQTMPDGGEGYYRKFCDADFQALPVEGFREFLCSYNGYRMFLLYNSSESQDTDIEVYDPECNLIFTTAGKYFYSVAWENLTPVFMSSGWLPVKELSTSRAGFVNVYTQEWHPLESDDYVLYGSGMLDFTIGTMSNSFYSDGLAFVADSEAARQYGWNVDRKIEGFIDETGAFAFRFDDLPDFDGLMVTTVTGYKDGSCMVAGRVDNGVKTGATTDDQIGSVDIDFFYRIDTSGKVLEEVDYDTFEAFGQEVLKSLGVQDTFKGGYNVYQADSLRVADGLELRVKNPLTADSVRSITEVGGYELVDANGNVYSLDDCDAISVLVGDDGTILLKCDSDYRNNLVQMEMGILPETTVWYRLNYKWIAPENYTLPDGQEKNLSSDGLTTAMDYRNQRQEIRILLMNMENINDLTLHFTGEDFTSTYAVQEEDYDYQDSAVGQIQDLDLEFATLSDDTITVTCDWKDDAGNPHHGTYDADNWSLAETE